MRESTFSGTAIDSERFRSRLSSESAKSIDSRETQENKAVKGHEAFNPNSFVFRGPYLPQSSELRCLFREETPRKRESSEPLTKWRFRISKHGSKGSQSLNGDAYF